MVIDWEHHYMPETLWLKKGGKKGERAIFYEYGKPRGNLHPELYDLEEQLRVMDTVGIDLSVLSIAVSSDDTQVALEECKTWDDGVAEVTQKYPKRFVGLAPVPPLGGEKAFSELERAIGSLGLKGVVVRSQVNGLSMDAKELYPFYRKV
jgi:predicted TIM-barrel fold metal-dependent hydrolase